MAASNFTVDLNCDCGEGYGPYTMGDDAAMLEIVTSASVACGLHAGDFNHMANVLGRAREKGVVVGAHPGFPDLWGFGRRALPFSLAEIERLLAYQIGAAMGMAALAGHRISYVKPHGALSNVAMADLDIAKTIARAVKTIDPDLRFLAIAGTKLEEAGRAAGLATVAEIYADRAYTDEGQLVSRALPGAVLHDAETIAARVLDMVLAGQIISISGNKVAVGVDSICVHGDTPDAVTIAKIVREKLEGAAIALKAFAPA